MLKFTKINKENPSKISAKERVKSFDEIYSKYASKLVRTYTDKHGYKDLCGELLGKSISKTEQSSDWGGELTKDQQKYAASDVLYLHKIKDKLDLMLLREKRVKLAKACFDFIQYRTDLDIYGWSDQDIFKH